MRMRDWWFGDEDQKPKSMPVPMVYVDDNLTFEYKRIVRDLNSEEAPNEEELNILGADGWHMSGVFIYQETLYVYMQRARR